MLEILPAIGRAELPRGARTLGIPPEDSCGLAPGCFATQPARMKVTLDLPDEYSAYLPTKETEVAEVLAAGLRCWRGRKTREIHELEEVLETLAGLPSAEEVLALHPSVQLSERTTALLAKNRGEGLTEDETAEWEAIMRVEHLVRIAKAKAMMRLKADGKAA